MSAAFTHANAEFKDWDSKTVLQKKALPKGTIVPPLALDAAKKSNQVIVLPKVENVHKNKHPGKTPAALAKIDNETEVFRRPQMTSSFRTALTQARVAKKWTQDELAKKLAQKVSLIKDYESGKAIPTSDTINKLNRLLGIKLPKCVAPTSVVE